MHDEIPKPNRVPGDALPPMPGLRLGIGKMARFAGPTVERVFELDRFQRLSLALETRLRPASARHVEAADIEVWFDGYLTDAIGQGNVGSRPAAAIAALFARDGVRSLARLRGSFTAFIWQASRRRAVVVTDRRGSRPLFYRNAGPHALALAPTIEGLRDRREAPLALDVEGLTELLVSRAFFDRRTLFRDIQRFPAASYLEIDADGFRFAPYWQPGEQVPVAPRAEAEQIEELHALLQQAVARVVARVERPVVFLSGGIGSRLLLGTLFELGVAKPAVVSLGVGPAGGSNADAANAMLLSAAHGLDLAHHACDAEADELGQAARMYDCRAELLDAVTPRVANHLAELHGSVITGDLFPGRASQVGSHAAALRAVHFHPLDSIPWLAHDWLRRPVREQVRATRQRLAHDWLLAFGQPLPDMFRDRLFYRDRIGNYANALAAGKLRYLEQARPCLDEDVIDFLFRLPPAVRSGRRLLHGVMARFHPHLHRLPYASPDETAAAVERCRFGLHASPGYAESLLLRLLDAMDARLGELFDREALRAFITTVAREGTVRAVPYNLLGRLPGAWRWQRHPRSPTLNPLAALLRLLQVNLYLTGESSG